MTRAVRELARRAKEAALKLLHTREARMVEAEVHGDDDRASLVVEGKTYGVLEATEAGLQLVEATDRERQALVAAGYALPSHVATGQQE